jgi:hypothetical protein
VVVVVSSLLPLVCWELLRVGALSQLSTVGNGFRPPAGFYLRASGVASLGEHALSAAKVARLGGAEELIFFVLSYLYLLKKNLELTQDSERREIGYIALSLLLFSGVMVAFYLFMNPDPWLRRLQVAVVPTALASTFLVFLCRTRRGLAVVLVMTVGVRLVSLGSWFDFSRGFASKKVDILDVGEKMDELFLQDPAVVFVRQKGDWDMHNVRYLIRQARFSDVEYERRSTVEGEVLFVRRKRHVLKSHHDKRWRNNCRGAEVHSNRSFSITRCAK